MVNNFWSMFVIHDFFVYFRRFVLFLVIASQGAGMYATIDGIDKLMQHNFSTAKKRLQAYEVFQRCVKDLKQEQYFFEVLCLTAKISTCSDDFFSIVVNYAWNRGWSLDYPDNNPDYAGIDLSPLHLAAQTHQLEKVRCLLKMGANPNLLNSRGEPVLDYCLKKSSKKMIKLIRKYGGQTAEEQVQYLHHEQRQASLFKLW